MRILNRESFPTHPPTTHPTQPATTLGLLAPTPPAMLRSGLLLLCCASSASGGMPGPLRSVGWYRTDAPWPACVPPEQVPWDSLTHLCIDSPTIAADYTASCVQSAETKKVAAMARKHGVKPVWIIDESVFPCSWCAAAGRTDYNRTEMRNQTRRRNFLRTIGKAAEECGIEFSNPKLLAEHVGIEHRGVRFPCRADGCNHKESSLSTLVTRHLVVSRDFCVSWVAALQGAGSFAVFSVL